jgi:ATP synthase protein I
MAPKPDRNPLHDYLKYAGLGFEILACILICAGVGYGLDHWLETEKPWFLLGGALLGCSAAIYLMIRSIGNPK